MKSPGRVLTKHHFDYWSRSKINGVSNNTDAVLLETLAVTTITKREYQAIELIDHTHLFSQSTQHRPAGGLTANATEPFGSVGQGRFLDVVEPSLELADEREIFRTARHRQRSMRCLPEP